MVAVWLPSRSLATTAARKRKITQRIMTLAVEHQFVTPFTALLVESEDATERLLADSPKDPKLGCCSGAWQTAAQLFDTKQSRRFMVEADDEEGKGS